MSISPPIVLCYQHDFSNVNSKDTSFCQNSLFSMFDVYTGQCSIFRKTIIIVKKSSSLKPIDLHAPNLTIDINFAPVKQNPLCPKWSRIKLLPKGSYARVLKKTQKIVQTCLIYLSQNFQTILNVFLVFRQLNTFAVLSWLHK